MGVVASVALMASSCNLNETPVFDDSDAFVAFGSTTYAFSEQAGVVQIPITLASVEGISTTIAYEAADDSAIEGDNYSLVDPTATLAFSSEVRTAYVEVNIVDVAGVFTGDLKFTLTITNTGSVDAGTTSSCTVTIEDEDHPLSALFGTYAVTTSSYWYGDYSYNMVISKDDDDVTMVRFANIADVGLSAGFYGIVNADMTQIVVPLGQIHPTLSTSYGDGNIYMYGCTADLYLYYDENMIFEITDTGSAIKLYSADFAPAISAGKEGYFEILLPPYTAVKSY